MIFLAVIFKRS